MLEREKTLRGLLELIREDYRTHGGDWTLPGFRAVAVHRFGVWTRALHPRLLRAPFSFIYNTLYRYVRNHYSIELVPSTKIGRRLTLAHWGGIAIGASGIGDDCIIRQSVTVGGVSGATADRAPKLMNRVEVGCGAVIIGSIVIGDDVRIGPNAVVTTDVPAGAAVIAPPPRIVPINLLRKES